MPPYPFFVSSRLLPPFLLPICLLHSFLYLYAFFPFFYLYTSFPPFLYPHASLPFSCIFLPLFVFHAPTPFCVSSCFLPLFYIHASFSLCIFMPPYPVFLFPHASLSLSCIFSPLFCIFMPPTCFCIFMPPSLFVYSCLLTPFL